MDSTSPVGLENESGGGTELIFFAIELSRYTTQRDWNMVIQLWERDPRLHSRAITSLKNTPLHVAINDGTEHVVMRLVELIKKTSSEKALEIQNEREETPLHCAAARGSVKMCELIIDAGKRVNLDLLGNKNKWGETPIFVAAHNNHKDVFHFLLMEAAELHSREELYQFLTRKDGDTVLHSAIWKENFDLAFHIIQLCPWPEIVDKPNHKGMAPINVFVSIPSVFRSGIHLSWCQKIIYYFIHIDPLKYDPDPIKKTEEPPTIPANYLTCYQFLSCCYSGFVRASRWMWEEYSNRKGKEKEEGDLENPRKPPSHINKCFKFLPHILKKNYYLIGIAIGKIFQDRKEQKQKHEWSVQILDEVIEVLSMASLQDGGYPGTDLPFETPFSDENILFAIIGDGDKYRTPKGTTAALKVAIKNGVTEVVNKLLLQFPQIIWDAMDKNILLLAVENKQPGIFVALQKHIRLSMPNVWNDLLQAVDDNGNTILHLAARSDECSSHPWQNYGSGALQMQRRIKWYEYIKSFLPSHFVFLENNKSETPGQIFIRDNKELLKNSSEWLNKTSESCSVVAALVAGVSFATSSTLPGGNDDKNGKPKLEGQPAFELFAMTALIALCFSVTALMMFLSLLTSQKQPTDFKKKLPLKLFLALSSLFASIVAMFTSFCAAHSFVLEEKFKKAVLPLYVATALPVYFTIVEFPLYMDLLETIVREVQRPYDYIYL